MNNLFENLNASRWKTRYGVLDCTRDTNSIIKYINNDRPAKYGMKKAVWFAKKVNAI